MENPNQFCSKVYEILWYETTSHGDDLVIEFKIVKLSLCYQTVLYLFIHGYILQCKYQVKCEILWIK